MYRYRYKTPVFLRTLAINRFVGGFENPVEQTLVPLVLLGDVWEDGR
jgi:hypothetical protein